MSSAPRRPARTMMAERSRQKVALDTTCHEDTCALFFLQGTSVISTDCPSESSPVDCKLTSVRLHLAAARFTPQHHHRSSRSGPWQSAYGWACRAPWPSSPGGASNNTVKRIKHIKTHTCRNQHLSRALQGHSQQKTPHSPRAFKHRPRVPLALNP